GRPRRQYEGGGLSELCTDSDRRPPATSPGCRKRPSAHLLRSPAADRAVIGAEPPRRPSRHCHLQRHLPVSTKNCVPRLPGACERGPARRSLCPARTRRPGNAPRDQSSPPPITCDQARARNTVPPHPRRWKRRTSEDTPRTAHEVAPTK